MFREIKTYLKQYRLIAVLLGVMGFVYLYLLVLYDTLVSMIPLPLRTTHRYGFIFKTHYTPAYNKMHRGEFEVEEISYVKTLLKDIDVFVDVGANIGLYTCIACSYGKHVIAFEPQNKNLKTLYLNLTKNFYHDTEVYPIGISNKEGLATLYGSSATGASLISGWAMQSKLLTTIIPVNTLDNLIALRFSGERLLIKIDVEGTEYEVIQGARHVLKMEPRPIWIIESCLHEYHPQGTNENFSKLFEDFWNYGYLAYTCDAQNRLINREELQNWVTQGRSESGVINYVFIPKCGASDS